MTLLLLRNNFNELSHHEPKQSGASRGRGWGHSCWGVWLWWGWWVLLQECSWWRRNSRSWGILLLQSGRRKAIYTSSTYVISNDILLPSLHVMLGLPECVSWFTPYREGAKMSLDVCIIVIHAYIRAVDALLTRTNFAPTASVYLWSHAWVRLRPSSAILACAVSECLPAFLL